LLRGKTVFEDHGSGSKGGSWIMLKTCGANILGSEIKVLQLTM
jgi:hypothetical protein